MQTISGADLALIRLRHLRVMCIMTLAKAHGASRFRGNAITNLVWRNLTSY